MIIRGPSLPPISGCFDSRKGYTYMKDRFQDITSRLFIADPMLNMSDEKRSALTMLSRTVAV